MSKKTCFMIFVVSVVVIMSSFVLNFSPVTSAVSTTFSAMHSIYISISAVIASLLLHKQKHYWLIMLGLAVIAGVVIQLFIVGGALMSVTLLYKIIAFIIYVYLVTLMRFMI